MRRCALTVRAELATKLLQGPIPAVQPRDQTGPSRAGNGPTAVPWCAVPHQIPSQQRERGPRLAHHQSGPVRSRPGSDRIARHCRSSSTCCCTLDDIVRSRARRHCTDRLQRVCARRRGEGRALARVSPNTRPKQRAKCETVSIVAILILILIFILIIISVSEGL